MFWKDFLLKLLSLKSPHGGKPPLAPLTDRNKPAVWAATPREAGWISPGIYGYLWVNGPNYLLPNEVPCLRLSAVSGLKNALCSVWIYMPRKTSLTGHSLPLRAQNPELTRQVLDILATALSFLGGSARRRGDIEEFVHSYPRCWWIGLGHLKPFKRSFCCCQE